MKTQQIVHLSGEEADTLLDTLDKTKDIYGLFEYLKQWDYGDSPEEESNIVDNHDFSFNTEDGTYYLAYHTGLSTVSLEYVTNRVNDD